MVAWTAARSSDRHTLSPVRMSRLLALLGGSLGSAAGWAAGAAVGTMTAFAMSVVGTAIGVYAARRLATWLTS